MSENNPNIIDRLKEQFLAESQEYLRQINNSLLKVESQISNSQNFHETIQIIFRNVHTIKGLSGMYGHNKLSILSHSLETLLDSLRLDKIPLTAEIIDLLFESTQRAELILKSIEDQSISVEIDDLIEQLELISGKNFTFQKIKEIYDLGEIGNVLTEFEETRLKNNIEKGNIIHKISVEVPIDSLEKSLNELKNKMGNDSEIITYIPSGNSLKEDTLPLEILITSRLHIDNIRKSLPGYSIIQVQKRQTPLKSSPSNIKKWIKVEQNELQYLKSLSKTVRVDIDKFDHLMNITTSLDEIREEIKRLRENCINNKLFSGIYFKLYKLEQSISGNIKNLRRGVLAARMIPIGDIFEKLTTAVRTLSRQYRKEIQLVISGEETELDKFVAEEIGEPLLHIIRNSVDHGIETSNERQTEGKPIVGTIALNAYPAGNKVVIEIEDDGRGIDETSVAKKVLEMGLLSEESIAHISKQQLLNMIFLPGVSTSKVVTEVSGRGMGMDIVKNNITRLGGTIELFSEKNIGTKIVITAPVTLALIPALIIKENEQLFAIPATEIKQVIVFESSKISYVSDQRVITIMDSTLPVIQLSELLGFEKKEKEENNNLNGLWVFHGDKEILLMVDEISGQQEIIVKQLGKSLSRLKIYSGAAELHNQEVVLVLEIGNLLEML